MQGKRTARIELICQAAFLLAAAIVPLAYGELYPFTCAPMFRDRPQLYATYELRGADGAPLPAVNFQLQSNYNGNPPGFGAGRKPRPSVNEFGRALDADFLKAHVARQNRLIPAELRAAEVKQTIVGPTSKNEVGVQSVVTIHVERD